MKKMDDKLFTPTEESFSEFAGQAGQCFCIPAYQRYFVWSSEDIDRFVQDVLDGLKTSISKNATEKTFLGTVTCFQDARREAIEPRVRQQEPRSVLNIVDGQQRLTVFMICAATLHDYIRVAAPKCNSPWLKRIAKDRMHELYLSFITEMTAGDKRLYPKMIRAFDDQWSTNASERRYHAPLSYYINSYVDFFKSGGSPGPYEHKGMNLPQQTEELRKAHEQFEKKVSGVKRSITKICDGSYGHLVPVSEFIQKKSIIRDICNLEEMPDEPGIDLKHSEQQKLLSSLLLSAYIINHVHFISLVALSEARQFAFFESLNTTGQILTAIETFKPEVVSSIGVKEYAASNFKKYFDNIDRYIATLETEDQQIKSQQIVTNFALAENGERIAHALRDQQEYLRTKWRAIQADKVGNSQQADLFVQHLMATSQVVQYFWDDWIKNIPEGFLKMDDELKNELPEVQLCLDYLYAAGHTICRSLVARYYLAVIRSDNARRNACISELFKVIKATAAFFAIWRSTRHSTDRIDGYHRQLMKEGVPECCGPLSRSHFSDGKVMVHELASADSVIQAYKSILRTHDKGSKTKVLSQADYINKMVTVPIYLTHRQTARLLLQLALHDAIPSPDHPGHLKDGRKNCQPMLDDAAWYGENYETIEHIIPQSAAKKFVNVYEDNLHRLGNLTLLSKKANSILGKAEWSRRREIYTILSTGGKQDIAAAIKKTKLNDVLSEESIEYLETMPFTPALKALCSIKNLAMDEMVDSRTRNLAGRAWKILAERWLNWKRDEAA